MGREGCEDLSLLHQSLKNEVLWARQRLRPLNQPHTQKWLPGGLQSFLLPQSPVKGAAWADSSHQRAIVSRTEGLCAYLTLPSLTRLLPAEAWLLEDGKAGEGAVRPPRL